MHAQPYTYICLYSYVNQAVSWRAWQNIADDIQAITVNITIYLTIFLAIRLPQFLRIFGMNECRLQTLANLFTWSKKRTDKSSDKTL